MKRFNGGTVLVIAKLSSGLAPLEDLEVRRVQVLLKVYRMLGKICSVKRASVY